MRLEVVRLAETFASIRASLDAIQDLYPTVLDIGYYGGRRGLGHSL